MLIDTAKLLPGGVYGDQRLTADQVLQVYNGLDVCLTTEIFNTVSREHESSRHIWEPIYNFEKALQAPYLDLMQRGILVDEMSRRNAAIELRGKIETLQSWLDAMAFPVWGKGLNPRSPLQLKQFLFEHMRLPEQWLSKKGVRSLSVSREALEKLDDYIYARPFVNVILAIRDLGKQLEVFETSIDPDGRFRAAYNIAGTETGRPSSSENAFGTGRNAQNIAPGLRYVFVADRGYRMAVIDLEQVEARDVGFFIGCLFDDWDFLDSCESGDLHTNNARRIWPELGWTGDKRTDRLLADKNFYREFSFRDMAKRGSHLSNYMGTAWTAARALKVPIVIMEMFQARYCRGGEIDGRAIDPAFPGIPCWWEWTARQLQTSHCLTTPFGRRRHFFGRPGDDTTLREAIAFLPQSTTADRMNLGLWRVWTQVPEVELLAQTYDSITFQYDETLDENEVIAKVLQLIRVELVSPSGRRYVVPGEAKVGWNWGARVDEADQAKARAEHKKVPRLNLDGLVKHNPAKRDGRTRHNGLQRIMA